jgi:hypothetical protein
MSALNQHTKGKAMLDTLDLARLASTGQTLARVDDVDYLSAHVVLACPSDGAPTIYCPYSDWRRTPIARLAELLRSSAEFQAQAEANAREVVRLSARVAELERRLTAPPETPKQNQEKMFQAQSAALTNDPGPCPDCGKHDWLSPRALQMHRQRAHQGMTNSRSAAPPADDQGWRCAEVGCTGAFTRDLHDPAHCTRHAVHTNGVEVAA